MVASVAFVAFVAFAVGNACDPFLLSADASLSRRQDAAREDVRSWPSGSREPVWRLHSPAASPGGMSLPQRPGPRWGRSRRAALARLCGVVDTNDAEVLCDRWRESGCRFAATAGADASPSDGAAPGGGAPARGGRRLMDAKQVLAAEQSAWYPPPAARGPEAPAASEDVLDSTGASAPRPSGHRSRSAWCAFLHYLCHLRLQTTSRSRIGSWTWRAC